MPLIDCFKPGNPDSKLHCDEEQLKAHPGKLIRWDDREKFLRGELDAKPAKAPKTPKPPQQPQLTKAQQANADAAELEDLFAQAKALGVETHHRMKADSLRQLIAQAKADKQAADLSDASKS